jgi:hypothetical protein
MEIFPHNLPHDPPSDVPLISLQKGLAADFRHHTTNAALYFKLLGGIIAGETRMPVCHDPADINRGAFCLIVLAAPTRKASPAGPAPSIYRSPGSEKTRVPAACGCGNRCFSPTSYRKTPARGPAAIITLMRVV